MTPNPPAPVPDDPYANKTLVSAFGVVVLTGLRWAVSDNFELNDEGIIALGGAITTLGVFVISNFKRYIFRRR